MQKRIRIVLIIVFITAGLLIARLFFLQVVYGDFYQATANRQYTRTPDTFNRGTIYFTKKDGARISAATVKHGYVVAINPSKLKDPAAAYSLISNFINIDEDKFFRDADKAGDPYEEVAHKLNEPQANLIRGLDIAGLNVYPETWRYYPGGSLASHILGFVGYKGDKRVGRYGIEKRYESLLSRDESESHALNSVIQLFLDIKRKIFNSNFDKGDVVLTIEPDVQSFAEAEIGKVREKYSAEQGGVIIIEPMTGRIVSMAATPGFDLNNFGKTKDFSMFANPHVQSVFEMGSIMKPITIASAIDAGVVDESTSYYDTGSVVIDGRKISNYNGKGNGQSGLQDILNHSINTGAVFVQRKLGNEKFRKYFTDLGFGQKTGIELPDEVSGLVDNLQSPRDIEYATASFGQGVAITPIQMVRALSVLANGGKLIKPHIVERTEIIGGIDSVTKPEVTRRVFSENTSKRISKLLANVVDEALLGGTVSLAHYSIAAKTGTAQLPDLRNGGYYKDKFLHTFFGYVPASDPRFLVFLFLEKPHGVRYASHSLTKPFMDMIKFLINYYQIPPDR